MSRWTTPRRCAVSSAEPMRFCRILTSAQRKRARGEPRGQRRTVDELHRQIRAPKVGVDGKHEIAHDRFMLERVQDRRLAPEEIENVGIVRQLGPDHLDRDGVAGLDVEAPVNLAHAALSDQALDLVNAVEAHPRSNTAAGARLKYGPVLHGPNRSRPETRASDRRDGSLAAGTASRRGELNAEARQGESIFSRGRAPGASGYPNASPRPGSSATAFTWAWTLRPSESPSCSHDFLVTRARSRSPAPSAPSAITTTRTSDSTGLPETMRAGKTLRMESGRAGRARERRRRRGRARGDVGRSSRAEREL